MSRSEPEVLSLRLLAGSGRSGTTWLQDVLCEANDLHPVFEPLHPKGWGKAKMLSRRYAGINDDLTINADFDLDDGERFWHSLLTGDYPSVWIDYRVRPDRLKPHWYNFKSLSSVKRWLSHWVKLYQHRSKYARRGQHASLIKTIRANLLLPWLANRPDTHWAMVIRHPAAVVESQLRLKGDWNATRIASHYANDHHLAVRLGRDWTALTGDMRSNAELFTLVWCLENLLPLEDISQAQDHVIFYEKLADNQPAEWAKLLGCLALQKAPDAAAIKRPSQQSSEALGRSSGSAAGNVLDRLSVKDKEGIQRVLDLFDVGFYHTGTLMPDPGKLMPRQSWQTN